MQYTVQNEMHYIQRRAHGTPSEESKEIIMKAHPSLTEQQITCLIETHLDYDIDHLLGSELPLMMMCVCVRVCRRVCL